MRHMIEGDPVVRLELEERLRLANRLGRSPTDDEIHADREERYRRQQEREANWAENVRRAEEARVRERADRQRVLDARRRNRTAARVVDPGSGPEDELARRTAANEPDCRNRQFIGEKGKPLVIGGDLELFNFDGSTFREVTFTEDARLNGASFVDARFENVDFRSGCEMDHADFSRATLTDVHFGRACLIDGVSFQLARFMKGVTIEFDRNNLSGAIFLRPRRDQWHRLSRVFSPFAQILVAILSLSYFAIILLKLHIFRALDGLQHLGGEKLQPRGSATADFDEITVFEFVFGTQWTTAALAVLIIMYQAFRLFLTMKISPLIEAERQSGHTPPWESFSALVGVQRLTRTLGLIALAVFLYELYGLLDQDPLLIPRGLLLR